MKKYFNDEEYTLILKVAAWFQVFIVTKMQEYSSFPKEDSLNLFKDKFTDLSSAFLLLNGITLPEEGKLNALSVLIEATAINSEVKGVNLTRDQEVSIINKLTHLKENHGKTINIRVVAIPDLYDFQLNGSQIGNILDIDRIVSDLYFYSMEERHYHYFLLTDMEVSETIAEVIKNMATSLGDNEYLEDVANDNGVTNLKFNAQNYLVSYEHEGMNFEVTYSESI